MPCLVNRRSTWTGRILMEAKTHRESAFITLTYTDDHLPKDSHLSRRDAQLFIKRLRRLIAPRKIRHIIVGEYGTLNQRPHLHAIIFGIGSEELIRILPIVWKLGSVEPNRFKPFGDLTVKNARYLAGYVTKKIHSKQLNGRPKEFQMQSRDPAIGDLFIKEVAKIWRGSGLIPNHLSRKEPSNLLMYISGIRGTYTKYQTNTIRIDGKKYPTSTRFNKLILEELGAEEKALEFERDLALIRLDQEPIEIEKLKESEILANRIMSKAQYKL